MYVSLPQDRLFGLVVRRPPWERKIPGSNPACAGIFSGSSHTSDLKVGTPVATLPGAWRYRVSAGTGRPSVSVLCLGEMESLICNFYLVWQHVKLSEQIHPWDTIACCWDVKQPTNNNILTAVNCHQAERSAPLPWQNCGLWCQAAKHGLHRIHQSGFCYQSRSWSVLEEAIQQVQAGDDIISDNFLHHDSSVQHTFCAQR